MTAAPAFKVLVVEDNPIHVKLTLVSLERIERAFECRISAAVARDGEEAVELAASNCFDVILMDVGLPKMDGLEVTRRIREQESSQQRFPVIIGISAYAMGNEAADGIAAGMDQYLTKPVDHDEFILTVANALVVALETDTSKPPDSSAKRLHQ